MIATIIGAITGFFCDNLHIWTAPVDVWCLIMGCGCLLGTIFWLPFTSLNHSFVRLKVALGLILIAIIMSFIRVHYNMPVKTEQIPSPDTIATECEQAKWSIAIKYINKYGNISQETLYVKGNTLYINDLIKNAPAVWKKLYGQKNKLVSVEKNLCFIPEDYAKKYAKENNLTYHCALTYSEKAYELCWEDGVKGKDGINEIP
jgi:hypothetical protein